MKPILIDAYFINMGGAFMILNHLIDNLIQRSVHFVLLKDVRCPQLKHEEEIDNIIVVNSFKARNSYLNNNRHSFSSVLSLGNVPPPSRMYCKVYTYIHNVSLLDIPKGYPLSWKFKAWLKRNYIGHYSKFTDSWIVQTSHTRNLVLKFLPCKNKDILIYPFYHIPKGMDRTPKEQRTDYIFVGQHTFAKGHEYLVDAWIELSKLGFNQKLHLTVQYKPLVEKIQRAVNNGVNIINHGKVEHDKLIDLYNKSRATIYPSLNESLGLGIIEAISAGCDVLGCDLPYMHCVCRPSGVFAPSSATSIVEAVKTYEGASEKTISKLIIQDKVNEIISLLIS